MLRYIDLFNLCVNFLLPFAFSIFRAPPKLGCFARFCGAFQHPFSTRFSTLKVLATFALVKDYANHNSTNRAILFVLIAARWRASISRTQNNLGCHLKQKKNNNPSLHFCFICHNEFFFSCKRDRLLSPVSNGSKASRVLFALRSGSNPPCQGGAQAACCSGFFRTKTGVSFFKKNGLSSLNKIAVVISIHSDLILLLWEASFGVQGTPPP